MKNQSKRILVVEDERPLITALRVTLEKEGYTVHTALNGEEGLHEALQHHPDLILLDIVMPVMDGVEFLNRLREDEWGKQARVMLLTNLTNASTKELSNIDQVCGYLVKSNWKLHDVVTRCGEVLQEA